MNRLLKILAVLVMLIFSSYHMTKAQQIPNYVFNFVKDLSNVDIGYGEIIQRYICRQTDGSVSTGMENVIITQLKEYRDKLTKPSLTEGPQILNYSSLPSDQQVLSLDTKEFSNVYLIRSGGKEGFYIYTKGNRIASIATLNKGGKRIFMLICK